MNPPVVKPASPVVAPREDPSTVEAPPAVPLAANPADAGDPATAAGRPQLRPGLPALRLDPHQRRPVPLCPPPRVPILARLVRRLLAGKWTPLDRGRHRRRRRRRVHRTGTRLGWPRQCPPPCQAGGPRRPRCRPQGQARRPRQQGLSKAAQVQHRGRPVFASWGACVGHVHPSPIRPRRLPVCAGGGCRLGWDSADESTVADAKRASVLGWPACLDGSAAPSSRSVRPAVQPLLDGHWGSRGASAGHSTRP
ncbi:hypothetical protein PF011_g27722 [Phytophthora fragariae]|uniref:Uncharacterized protein n=1 Tax=Phytophthora fragariae TaxID=53985 RepID=A0A6A3HEI3_9STRA|nr:hypothetical protein PF011_g27722 [Phytophthora fragariae]